MNPPLTETCFAPLSATVDDSRIVTSRRSRRGSRTPLAPPVLTARRTAVRPGRFGRFILLERLGEGAMGAVFRAYDPDLDREVALKVQHERQGSARARAMSEAKALAQVHHPNVVRVYDVGAVADDVFVVMELLEGASLRTWLKAADRAPRDVLRVFADASKGLMAAHDAGLVHRDIKPDNIFVTFDGRVVVVDFGLARAAPNVANDSPSEATGIVGTPAYMAPEQHRGEHATAKSDQFSIAVALWEAWFGQRPHHAERLAELRDNVLHGRVQRPAAAQVPRTFVMVLERALSVDPADRFVSIAALFEALLDSAESARGERRAMVIAKLLVVGSGLLIGGGAVMGFKPGGSALVMGGFVVALLLTRLAHAAVPGGSQLVWQVTAVTNPLYPALLFSSLAAEFGVMNAVGSWLPALFAVGVCGALLQTSVRRLRVQTAVACTALVATHMAWLPLVGPDVPLLGTPRSFLLNTGGIVLLSFVMQGNAQRLARVPFFDRGQHASS